MARTTLRPARTLLIFLTCVAVLYGLAALGQTWQPRLGLDLQGGTRITLQAISEVNPTKLEQARSILDQRVNGQGVSESEVTTQGTRNIVVEIPGKNRKDLTDLVKRTAQLRFRIVAGQPIPSSAGQPTPSPSASPSDGATPKPKASSSANPASPSATPNPRPAPAVDQVNPVADPSPSPSPSPSAEPTAPPAGGASSDNPIAWAQNPPAEWQARQLAYECPPPGATNTVTDNPDQPLVTCDDEGNRFLLSEAIIEGTQLDDASYGTPPQGVGWAVNLSFKGDARKIFAETTRALYSNQGQFAIVLDGEVISYAGVNEPILDGNAQITGGFSEAEAKSLSNSLKYGALPVRFDPDVRIDVIGPSLAGSQLSAGILAGVIGLVIVMLYCLFYYRGLGLVVIASLLFAALITYATVLVLAKTANFTLTLPGIAGLIVAVGITADSFIVYFERIRDEMREGKSMRVAVETGWLRARNTCLAADAVSLLAAVVLYIFAIGVVRGFAFALGISTLIDVIVFFWFTKPMVSLLATRKFFNSGSKLSGLSAETLGIDEIAKDRPERRLARPERRPVGGRA